MAADHDVGVVLMNMGGPSSLDEVRDYMRRVLSDGRVVRLPAGKLYQGLFASLVSKRREGRVRERYAAIGGRSPLLDETQHLADSLSDELGAPVSIAMRYSAPFARDAVTELLRGSPRTIVGLPLYPQFSTATTTSSIEDLQRVLPADVRLLVVERHHLEPGFIDALVDSVQAGLERVGGGEGSHLLFTAHSIPVAYTRSGDPYVSEVEQTVDAVRRRLPASQSSSLAFQSAMRFGEWHGPSVDEELERLLERGVQRLLVQPVTFVSENLETLYDLDIAFRRAAEARGIERFERLAAPGRSPRYLQGLARQVRTLMEDDGAGHA